MPKFLRFGGPVGNATAFTLCRICITGRLIFCRLSVLWRWRQQHGPTPVLETLVPAAEPCPLCTQTSQSLKSFDVPFAVGQALESVNFETLALQSRPGGQVNWSGLGPVEDQPESSEPRLHGLVWRSGGYHLGDPTARPALSAPVRRARPARQPKVSPSDQIEQRSAHRPRRRLQSRY